MNLFTTDMGYAKVPVKMKARKEENKRVKKAAHNKNPSSELNKPCWSVVTFENCAASGLTYDEAAGELEKLAARKVSGLCIVTNETARRVAENSK